METNTGVDKSETQQVHSCEECDPSMDTAAHKVSADAEAVPEMPKLHPPRIASLDQRSAADRKPPEGYRQLRESVLARQERMNFYDRMMQEMIEYQLRSCLQGALELLELRRQHLYGESHPASNAAATSETDGPK